VARKKFLLGMADPSFGFWYTTTTADPQPSMSLDGNCQSCWIDEGRAAHKYFGVWVSRSVRSFTNEAVEVVSAREQARISRRVRAEGTAALFKAIRCCTVEISGSVAAELDCCLKITLSLYIKWFRRGYGEGSSGSLQAPRDKTTELWHSDGGYVRGEF
jgi:hypothetical protein